LPIAELPSAYRQLCQQLAIARYRRYSAALLARLNQLALRAYQQIYRAPQRRWPVVLHFLTADFPKRVRADADYSGCARVVLSAATGNGIGGLPSPGIDPQSAIARISR